MARTYESMFVIDNDAVRAGWKQAKASVVASVEKHGGKVLAARHWAERRLAYPIRRKRRGTYMLAYCELPPQSLALLRNDMDISDSVLRYLFLSTDEVPAKELELSAAEDAADFVVPEPPSDDAHEQEEPVAAPASDEDSDDSDSYSGPSDDDDAAGSRGRKEG